MERGKEGSRNTDSEPPELEPSEGSGGFVGKRRIMKASTYLHCAAASVGLEYKTERT